MIDVPITGSVDVCWTELDAKGQCLRLSQQLCQAVMTINESLTLLRRKRPTVEEKMISSYLHHTAALMNQVGAHLNCLLADPQRRLPPEDVRVRIHETAGSVLDEAGKLLKATSYSFNFLEQYFEHDFFDRLTHEHRFLEALEEILVLIQDQSGAHQFATENDCIGTV